MSLDDLRRDWTTLGAADPLWAVYVAPGVRNGRWDLDAFFATGRREVDAAMDHIATLGLTPGRERALDFGAGVGRLSAALAGHFGEVIAVDIAPTMLDTARRIDRSGGRCRFVLNDSPDLAFQPAASVDLVYSSLVLQHLPPTLAEGYLGEFVRILRPGGVAVVQAATRPHWSLKGLVFRWAPRALVRWGQRALLGYPAPMDMRALPREVVTATVGAAGARLVDAVDDPSYGGHWTYTRYFVAAG